MAIVRAVLKEPLLPVEIVRRCRISRPALRRHLAKLKARGFVATERNCAVRLRNPDSHFGRCLLSLALS
jgi:predicted ArsR family transcriptional regulator